MESKRTEKTRRKILAAMLIAMLAIHMYGLLFTLNLHSAFAATDSYTVENWVFINVTSLNKGPGDWEIVKLTVREPQEGDLTTQASPGTSFTPNVTLSTNKIQDINERQEITTSTIVVGGETFRVDANTHYMMMDTFKNGTSIAVNTSRFYQNFSRIQQAYPVVEKTLLFDAPLNYAERFCDTHGYTLNNVVNSTYEETIDVNGLNIFSSYLVKTDYLVTERINNSALKSLEQYGGSLDTQAWWFLLIAIVVGFTIWQAAQAVVACHAMSVLGDMAKFQMELDANVTMHGIDAERDVQLALVGARAANEKKILEMIENGSLTYAEGSALLSKMGADYGAALSNRSTNIADMLEKYYNHTNAMWDKYANGLAISTSWADWIWPILILLIVGFSIYVVYALFLKKGPKDDASNVFIVQ